MTTEPKPLPKSLHTVTVLVRVARIHISQHACSASEALGYAVEDLGLWGKPDTHGLRAAALKQLEAQ